VAAGLVASLARPGGNGTGITNISLDLTAKQLQLLTELRPGMTRIVVLWTPPTPVRQSHIDVSSTPPLGHWVFNSKLSILAIREN
jgi:putative tryptophan/tyrosine transport system substrate-binding protein